MRSDPLAARGCVGGRHPGLSEAVTLRGETVEAWPRPVRLVWAGSLPSAGERTGDSGCPLGAEEGNVVGVRFEATHPSGGTSLSVRQGHVLHSVHGPVLVDRHSLRRREPSEVARRARHRGRANPGNREEPAPRPRSADAARLAARRCSRERATRCARKGRGSRPSSLRGIESSGTVPARRKQLQKSFRWCLASNKLTRSTLEKGTRRE